MTGRGYEPESVGLSLNDIPHTALQAVYHAVTGKTENLSKRLDKNVLISFSDFEQLYLRLSQQAQHYQLLAQPTVTIVVKQADRKSLRYSSWERFCSFQVNSSDITSEINLKMELIARLPNTTHPQRLIISISIDSGLPVLREYMKASESDPFFTLFVFMAREFPTVEISIDFVDFLIAKAFANVVEEWFNQLEALKISKIATFILNRMALINTIINQIGRIGLAIFFASYVWFNKGTIKSLGNLTYAFSIAVMTFCFLSVLSTYISGVTSRRVIRSVIPSLILFTEGDKKAFSQIKDGTTNPYRTLANVFFSGVIGIAINLASSYVYSLISK